MSTIKRLQRLTGDVKPDRMKPARNEVIGELRRRVETVMTRRSVTIPKPPAFFYNDYFSLTSLIRGEEVENDHGKFFLAHDLIHGSYCHGFRQLREISDLNMQALSLLANDPHIIHYDYTDGLFLDTETTGLAGGTGTLPFLIGLGWFEGESFIIRQLFVRDFKEERAALSFLLHLLKTKRFLVTYNGKAFDIGLLSTRLIMNRLHDQLSVLPNLDLLHPSRRLLCHRTDNSRLGTLEEAILGLKREGDLPGYEIPQRYFNWLKSRDARFMVSVFEHNRLDIISMVVLTIHLTKTLNGHHHDKYIDPYDLIAASRLLIDRGNISGALKILESFVESDDKNIAHESRKLLSLIYKRADHWDMAVKLWNRMIADDPADFFTTEELSKWYEHKKRNFEKAHLLVNQALCQAQNMTTLERESLNHRLKRLRIKLRI